MSFKDAISSFIGEGEPSGAKGSMGAYTSKKKKKKPTGKSGSAKKPVVKKG